MSDDEVVAAAKEGDGTAWRELYRAHAGRLVAWLRTRHAGDSAVTAEDLASEAWLVAAQKIPEFSGTSSDFAGWLFGIARNLNATTTRRSLRRRTDPTLVDEEAVGLAEQPDREGGAWVRETLARLPPRERDVVGCIDALGLDTRTTAAALDISAVAVRVARHRGLRRLRSLDHEVEPPPATAPASVGVDLPIAGTPGRRTPRRPDPGRGPDHRP